MATSRLGVTTPLAPPLYPSSVYTIPDLDFLDRIYSGEEPGFVYARDAHPNANQLAEMLSKLEHAEWSLMCASGMGAMTASLLSLVGAGDRVIASDRLYGRTNQLLKQELSRFGVTTVFVDCGDLAAVQSALQTPAKAMVIETMSNPMCRLTDIEAIARLCEARQCKLIVDNTFATPVLVRPLELGADIVVESLTKMIGGHSDVTLGAACGWDKQLFPRITQIMSIWGMPSSPFDCWLATRGLATLDLRMHAATSNAAELADWLTTQSSVNRVIYPGRADHPDQGLANRLLNRGCGNMLCFELKGGRDAVNRFMREAQGVPFSPSLGGTRTTCSYPSRTSHLYETAEEKQRQGITDGLIRLSVGVEDLKEIQTEMAKGLK